VNSHYIGSGPYCYANSLAMILGAEGPDPSAIEVLTGSPFGFQLYQGRLPWFDPLGWDPGVGLDAAISLLGWTCTLTSGGTEIEAVERLRDASHRGPVLVGPLEMGLLRHQPGMTRAIGADHFVVVLGVADGVVTFHDPHGHPFATLPVADFLASWGPNYFGYPAEPYTMRTEFHREYRVDVLQAMREALPSARRWLTGANAESLSGAAAASRLAELVEAGLDSEIREHLVNFAIRVGARRLADAAVWLGRIGSDQAADVLASQARLVGGLQLPMVLDDPAAAAAILRELAPTYPRLDEALSAEARVSD